MQRSASLQADARTAARLWAGPGLGWRACSMQHKQVQVQCMQVCHGGHMGTCLRRRHAHTRSQLHHRSESPGGPAPKSSQGHALRSRAKPRSCSGRATAGRAPHPAPRCCRQRRPTSTAAGRRSAPTPGARCLRARRQSTPSAAAPPPGGQLAVRTRRRRRLSPPPACAWHSEGHGLPWARTADDHKARYRRVGGGRLALGVAAAALLRAKGTPVGACARATLVAAEPPAAAGQNREAMASYLWSWLRA